ncbi:MAG TPA: carbohydrate-binding domain-containing protein [Prolixibacteraceae bacterium]|nr:carbohydrate-binding domain-containing protein [Prolixibacteraceae bacterium]
MRKYLLICICMLLGISLFAQKSLYVYKKDKSSTEYKISNIDSIYFSTDGAKAYFRVSGTLAEYQVSEIDSVSFLSSNTVYVTYNGNSASVVNPLSSNGVTVSVSNADVTVNSTYTGSDVTYVLKGTSGDGMFKIYSSAKFNLYLDGLTLTNGDGPAINIQSSKKTSLSLVGGTSNTLNDGSSYAKSSEDQKGTIFSEGQIVFDGTGALSVKSNSKHAICSDDYIEIQNGSITIPSSSKDGIHSNDFFKMSGGTLSITATGDGVECESGYIQISGGNLTANNASADVKGLVCDSTLTISGGTINLNISGNQSKGIKSSQGMLLSGGTITIANSGAAVLTASGSGYDPSYATAIKCDSTITVSGANIAITSSGTGGKGLSSDKNVNISGGTIVINTSGNAAAYTTASGTTDSYSAAAIDADGNINVLGGNITISQSGTGCKGITADGKVTFGDASNSPTVKITTTGSRFLVSGTSGYATANYAKPKCIKADGALTVNNGTFTLSTSNPSSACFDSGNTITLSGGTGELTVGGNQSKGFTSTAAMKLNGGTYVINTTGGVELETSGSGYDPAYCKAITCDADVNIGGSNITITSSGAAGKGVSSETSINMTSGSLKITSSGSGATYKNTKGTTDSYSAACLSAANISILGGNVTTSSSGNGGKGFKADTSVTIGDATNSPTIGITTTGSKFIVSGSDYCHPKAIVSDGSVTVNNGNTTISSADDGIHAEKSYTQNGGTVTINNSYEGVESYLITLNDGNLTLSATNDGINATAGTVSGGTESNDGSYLYVKGGTLITSCSNGDAIDSNGNIEISGGVTVANGPNTGVEEAADFNGTFNMKGGLFIGAGSNSNMTKAMSTSSTQPNMFISSSSSISSATFLHIQDSNGKDVLSFKPQNGGYKFLFSSTSLTKGSSYSIYTGGSYTGGSSLNGLYTGGTYSSSGATLKKTVSLSSSSTVNSITF